MNRRSRTLLTVTAAGALALAGCKSGKSSEAPAKQDHHPAPEGRVTVDQSAVLPVDVRAGVQRDFPGAAVTNVNKRTYDDRVVRFEVHVTTPRAAHAPSRPRHPRTPPRATRTNGGADIL